MGQYLHKFANEAERNQWLEDGGMVIPYVALIENSNTKEYAWVSDSLVNNPQFFPKSYNVDNTEGSGRIYPKSNILWDTTQTSTETAHKMYIETNYTINNPSVATDLYAYQNSWVNPISGAETKYPVGSYKTIKFGNFKSNSYTPTTATFYWNLAKGHHIDITIDSMYIIDLTNKFNLQ